MTQRSRFDTAALPRVGDPAAAERGLARWTRLGQTPDDGRSREGAAFDLEMALPVIFGNSPYLGESALAEPDLVRAVLTDGPDRVIEGLIEETRDAPLGARQRFMAALRQHKRRVALAVALADIFDLWSLEQITAALSRFADLAIRQALNHTMLEAAQRGELELAGETDPQTTSGLAVLGMGKLGALELNYSSDLDLIVMFAPDKLRCRGRDGPMALAVRLTRALVYLLEQRTQQGYVFRVD
ncbi:MAG: bifunctional [glutamine synthetase] adenylyltransferase/[glutamine synthetase]-adenylyl-L-tyrosine phosphorylase, partial [Geminicoccaceae bacterium]